MIEVHEVFTCARERVIVDNESMLALRPAFQPPDLSHMSKFNLIVSYRNCRVWAEVERHVETHQRIVVQV